MVNFYDFITGNSTYFNQVSFLQNEVTLIDYYCPIKENVASVWSHKNCLMYVFTGAKGFSSLDFFHESFQNQILFVRKGGCILHQRFDEPYHALIFMFNDAVLKDFSVEYPDLLQSFPEKESEFMQQPVVIELRSSFYIEMIFKSSLEYLKEPVNESRFSLELKFKELMINLLREKSDNAFYNYLSWICNDDSVSFMKLMLENSHFNFTTQELARTAGMSLSTFKRIFRSHFNMAPGRWLRDQRITKAKTLLSASRKNISEIAFELGYSDVAAFSKAFKTATSLSPHEFIRKKTVA